LNNLVSFWHIRFDPKLVTVTFKFSDPVIHVFHFNDSRYVLLADFTTNFRCFEPKEMVTPLIGEESSLTMQIGNWYAGRLFGLFVACPWLNEWLHFKLGGERA